jgi:hypothetical protein
MLWGYSNKRSFVSGNHLMQFIGSPMELNMFAHVLSKAQNKYPLFRFYAKNIAIIDPEEHKLWDHGTEEQRINYSLDIEEKSNGRFTADWDKLKNLRDELKKEYQKYFPSTKHGIINYKYSFQEMYEVINKLNKEFFDNIRNNYN